MKTDELIAGLPGEDLAREGLADLHAGRRTISAYWISISRSRLTGAGLIAEETASLSPEPELELYHLLQGEPGDAYSRYNSLLRELASFNSALDLRRRKLTIQPLP